MEFIDGVAVESGSVQAFDYSAVTKELLGSNEYYVLAGSGLPANSTLEIPPSLSDNQQALWKGDSWSVVSDYRGCTVYSDAGEMVLWSQIGDLPAGFSLQPSSRYYVVEAERKKSLLKASVDSEIAWRQDAVDAEIATAEEAAALSEWKKYRVLLMRIDTSKAPDIEWPTPPVVS